MSKLTDLIGYFAPEIALKRDAISLRRRVMKEQAGNYNAAGRGRRGAGFRMNSADAVEAMRADRTRISYISRDMLRNNPRVKKATNYIVGNVVGTGIVPTVKSANAGKDVSVDLVKTVVNHLTSTDIDVDGTKTIYGLQALAMTTTVVSGEVLIRRRVRRSTDGYNLPFQMQVLETDYLNESIDGTLTNGNRAVQGIEFNAIGERVAYHLYAEHPGGRYGAGIKTRRVSADNIIHLFDEARPGQKRGITWFDSVIPLLHDLADYQDAQVQRQKIASMFAGIMKWETRQLSDDAGGFGALEAGAILNLGPEDDLDFVTPPSVDGYEPFTRVTDRVIAAGLGITYEGFTGDYSNVNYSSGRMGRLDTDPNIKTWQNELMIARLCAGITRWTQEAVNDRLDVVSDSYEVDWTPQSRPVLDPTKDWPALNKAVRSGFKSRRGVIRELGGDPDKVEAEIRLERSEANGLIFDSDAANGNAKKT